MVSPALRAHSFSGKYFTKTFFWLLLGALLAAFALKVLLIPNNLIDGGVVGVAMIGSHFLGRSVLPYLLILLNAPFLFLAYKLIGRVFVIQMLTAVFLYAVFLALFELAPVWFHFSPLEFRGEIIEVMILGGFTLGVGAGLIIRYGGSTDGTEILAIILNRRFGFTLGQIILFFNVFIFVAAGFVYSNWHTAFQSLMVYVVCSKVMDIVIVGFDEMKSVIIISQKSKLLSQIIMRELGVGVTLLYGRGGYRGDEKEMLYIIVERLQLAELKELIHREDPKAFVAIENIHEVINARVSVVRKARRKLLLKE